MDIFEYWHLWLILTAVLLIAELLTTGFLLICFAAGTLVATLPALVGLSLEWQLATFALSSLLALYWLRPFLRKINPRPDVRSGVDALLGRRVRLPKSLGDSTLYVEISIGGDVWRARGVRGQAIAAGATVEIVERDGLTLLVEEVQD